MILYSVLGVVLSILSISITTFFVNKNNEVNTCFKLPVFVYSILMLGFPVYYLIFNDFVIFQSVYGVILLSLIAAVLHIILYFFNIFF